MSEFKGKRCDTPERDIEAYFQEQVIAHGGVCYLVAPRGTKGPPDTVVIWPRDGWAKVDILEIKTIGGGLEEPQVLFHAMLAMFNCHVRVIWTKAQVDRYVEENGTRQVSGCTTIAGLLERARASRFYERIKTLQVPRRKKKDAIQLAPAGEEFG
ncbi:MAG: hypothetical protein ACRCS0_00985 [Albidovulum sp.]